MASNFTPYTIIENIANRFLPTSVKDKATWDIESIEQAKQYANSPLSEFPLQRYGNNLIAAPNMYLEEGAIKDIKEDVNLPYNTGGTTSMLSGIGINPQSEYNPFTALLHEMQHYKDLFRNYTNPIPKEAVNIKELQEKEKQSSKNILANYKNILKDSPVDAIASKTITGQTESDEIVAQLKSYEAMLPAGMSIFQSPLGKKMFKTNEDKLWWLNKTSPSMTKYSFEKKKK